MLSRAEDESNFYLLWTTKVDTWTHVENPKDTPPSDTPTPTLYVENPINIISMCLSHVEKEWKHFCLTPLSTCHHTYKPIHLHSQLDAKLSEKFLKNVHTKSEPNPEPNLALICWLEFY